MLKRQDDGIQDSDKQQADVDPLLKARLAASRDLKRAEEKAREKLR